MPGAPARRQGASGARRPVLLDCCCQPPPHTRCLPGDDHARALSTPAPISDHAGGWTATRCAAAAPGQLTAPATADAQPPTGQQGKGTPAPAEAAAAACQAAPDATSIAALVAAAATGAGCGGPDDSSALLPLDLFDDASYETRSPDQWVPPGEGARRGRDWAAWRVPGTPNMRHRT